MCYIINVAAKLTPEDILALNLSFTGRCILYHATLGSTMDAAREAARRGAPAGAVIIAGEQRAGRGRLKRGWLSPSGSLAFSVILRPTLEQLPALIMAAALAVLRGIEAATGLNAALKWPNDVLLNGRKVSGILIENSMRDREVEFSVIGIGINVNVRLADYPDIPPTATSLSDELGREVALADLIARILRELDGAYRRVQAGESLLEEWRSRLATLGRHVRATSRERVEEGVAEGVDRDGGLLIRREDGSLVKVLAADVTLRE